MVIVYNTHSDVLYLRLDDHPEDVVNRRVDENIVLDIGADDRIVGIEILDASQHVRLGALLPIEYVANSAR